MRGSTSKTNAPESIKTQGRCVVSELLMHLRNLDHLGLRHRREGPHSQRQPLRHHH